MALTKVVNPLIADIGTTIGDLVQVVDIGGAVAGLPALDGSNLINVGGSGGLSIAAVDATGGITLASNTRSIVTANDGSNVTLPASGADRQVEVFNRTGAALTVVPDGSDTINGGVTFTVADDKFATFTIDGALIDWAGGTDETAGSPAWGDIGGTLSAQTDLQAVIDTFYTITELDAGQLDNRYYTETEVDATFAALGTASALNVGVAVADVVQVADVGGGTPGLPALNGSLLTGLATSGGVAPQPIHTTTAALSLVTNSIIACTAVPSTTTLPETGSDSRVVVLNRTASAITVARKTAYTIRNGATGGLTTIDIPAYSQGDFHVENSETEWNVQLTETGGEANITAAVGSGTYSVLATTPKTGSTLQYKKFDAGTNVSITDSSDILTIDTGANVITAAAVITDNVLVRGDGGAKGVQDTPIAVSDHTQVLTIDVTALSTGRTLTFSDENLDLSAIPQANVAGLTTSSSPQFTAVNINHATDTTITRVSAGVIAVEGKTVATVEDVRTNVPAVDSGASRTMAIASDLGSAGAQECFLRLSHASAQYDVVKNIAAVGQRFMVQWTNATPSQATPFTNTGGSCTFVPSSLPTVDTQYQSLCLLCVDATTDANVFHVLPSTL